MNKITLEKMAKWRHIGNGIWSKLPKDQTITDFTCGWDELTEYQRELYIAAVELEEEIYRILYSPFRFFWNIYYRVVH